MNEATVNALKSIAAAIDRHTEVMKRLPAEMTVSMRHALYGKNENADMFDVVQPVDLDGIASTLNKMYEHS